jgi:hypothetical protein
MVYGTIEHSSTYGKNTEHCLLPPVLHSHPEVGGQNQIEAKYHVPP